MLNQTLELLDNIVKSSLCFKMLDDLDIVFSVITLTYCEDLLWSCGYANEIQTE